MLKTAPKTVLKKRNMTDFTSSALEALWQNASRQTWHKGALYVVATPIGNIADISVRALYALQLADAIACEDTRHSKPLLAQYGIAKPLIAVHDYNESDAARGLIERIKSGERIALITDAGTPAISDPGARVVAAAHAAGVRVVPIAGASAAVVAMSAAGLDGGFAFIGFLPSKSVARVTALTELAASLNTNYIFYEAPHRLFEAVESFAQVFPARRLTIARELSKLHEDIIQIDLKTAPEWLKTAPTPRGEYVLILHAATDEAVDADPEWHAVLDVLLADNLPLKQAVALTVKLTHASKNEVYARALALKNANAR